MLGVQTGGGGGRLYRRNYIGGENKHISVHCVGNDSWLDDQCNDDGSQCLKISM